MPEIWSVHAPDDACDLAMRAPGAGRVASDEVMVAGSIPDDIRRAIRKVDPHSLVRDASDGWAEVRLDVADARDVLGRLSELELPDGPGYIQGDVARIPVRILVRDEAVSLFAPAFWKEHLRRRVGEEGGDR